MNSDIYERYGFQKTSVPSKMNLTNLIGRGRNTLSFVQVKEL